MIAIMKRQIRKGVFETNSSSVHAMAILNEADYKRYIEGEIKLDVYKGIVEAKDYEDYNIWLEGDVTSEVINGETYYAVAVYGHD